MQNFKMDSSEVTLFQTKVGDCEFALVQDGKKFRVMKHQNVFSILLVTRDKDQAKANFDDSVALAKDLI